MTSESKKPRNESSQDQSLRLRELQKLAKKSKGTSEILEFLDSFPDPTKQYKIVFPYGNDGEPLPWDSGLRNSF